jgi:AcrR family transcriptional regulator
MLRRRSAASRRNARPVRRSNVQRSAEMQTRILRATIDCLIAYGYAELTTTMVAEHAEVSRGAFLHHFRTKEDLVLAAVEHRTHPRRR